MTTETKEYVFTATGGWTVDGRLEPQYSAMGNVVGFKDSKGRIIQLVIALEVLECDSEGNEKFSYVTSERSMEKLGFSCLDYDRLEFEETNDRFSHNL
jgi:hypothetical protein